MLAILNCPDIKLLNSENQNMLDLDYLNEVKIIKTKIDGETRFFILLTCECIELDYLNSVYNQNYNGEDVGMLSIGEFTSDTIYSLVGEMEYMTIDGEKKLAGISVDSCKFVDIPIIEEILKLNSFEVTQFTTCLEFFKNVNGNYINFTFDRIKN